MKASMPVPSAAFVRLARQLGLPVLEGFEDEGLVRFDDPLSVARGLSLAGARRKRWLRRKAVVG
jgi:hypothetical protein